MGEVALKNPGDFESSYDSPPTGDQIMSHSDYLMATDYWFIHPYEEAQWPISSRVKEIEGDDENNPAELRSRAVSAAYYALELSSDLPSIEDAIRDMTKLDDTESPEDRKEVWFKLERAFSVDSLLDETFERWSGLSNEEKQAVLDATKEHDAKNTACLNSLKRMTFKIANTANISPETAQASEMILRVLIADELSSRALKEVQ